VTKDNPYTERPVLIGDLREGLCSSGLCKQLRAVAADEIERLTEDRDFWKAEAARWQQTAHKAEEEWAALSQDDGKVERALERSEEDNRRLRAALDRLYGARNLRDDMRQEALAMTHAALNGH